MGLVSGDGGEDACWRFGVEISTLDPWKKERGTDSNFSKRLGKWGKGFMFPREKEGGRDLPQMSWD